MTSEAIILAGGLGTRLRDTVPDLPKCMAPVAGKPFLFYVIDYFQKQGISHFIFALGYKSEIIEAYIKDLGISFVVSFEKEPLGTGGAIAQACSMAHKKNVLVLNGDTFFGISLQAIGDVHEQHQAACTVALKPMKNFDRYGSVLLNPDMSIQKFEEKKFQSSGFINGGIYMLNRDQFMHETFPQKFSFEKDYLEKKHGSGLLFGSIQDNYFIDIGIPEDYYRAQTELPLNL